MPSSEKSISHPKICFLIGFDRSGSSMISRVLAQHPKVNLLFHPFNSTEVTQTQWEYWQPKENHQDTFQFQKKMTEGILDKEYIKSDWFFNYSKSPEIKPDELNLIKDTKFHFKIDWLQENFPEIEVFGIWRDPRDILCSLVRNDFHRLWYANLNVELLRRICSTIQPLAKYNPLTGNSLQQYEAMALGIAMRTEMLMARIKKRNWLVYEEIIAEPDVHLNEFTARFGLSRFDFKDLINKDYNVVGEKFERTGQWKSFFSQAEKERINRIFQFILK